MSSNKEGREVGEFNTSGVDQACQNDLGPASDRYSSQGRDINNASVEVSEKRWRGESSDERHPEN